MQALSRKTRSTQEREAALARLRAERIAALDEESEWMRQSRAQATVSYRGRRGSAILSADEALAAIQGEVASVSAREASLPDENFVRFHEPDPSRHDRDDLALVKSEMEAVDQSWLQTFVEGEVVNNDPIERGVLNEDGSFTRVVYDTDQWVKVRTRPGAWLRCQEVSTYTWSDSYTLAGVHFGECTISPDGRLVRATFRCRICGAGRNWFGAMRNHVRDELAMLRARLDLDLRIQAGHFDSEPDDASVAWFHAEAARKAKAMRPHVWDEWIEAVPTPEKPVTKAHVDKALKSARGRLAPDYPFVPIGNQGQGAEPDLHNVAVCRVAYVRPKTGAQIVHRYVVILRRFQGQTRERQWVWEYDNFLVFDEADHGAEAAMRAFEFADRLNDALRNESMLSTQWHDQMFVPGTALSYDPTIMASIADHGGITSIDG